MNNLGDYLDKKAEQLDLGRSDELQRIQKLLDSWYPNKCRVRSFNNNRLDIIASSGAVANELRFKKHQLTGDPQVVITIRLG